ncbi:rhodanese-like domain-containing protein [Actinotalea sp. M2MS4P-6]|uniref:rhodanese-like domain-containing protein n=1 Tax=Actinotalea sp. M2MS4P-6 TaxID=2983762 RepID=UPI0021E5105C|nr:rhodanese-like domain-containing protein [Actinotalea sp. M2MS4P-6]MCV2394267.1 rhodanese-like domain-containing protein [Actinotalea sp. M2MS4P-6]
MAGRGRAGHGVVGHGVVGHGRAIDEILADARAGLDRLDPRTAAALLAEGRIVLVDTRPQHQRDSGGEVPGAVVIDRNVLEWRLDPRAPSRLPIARFDLPVAVLCAQGYSSSLAAASLRALGLARATDVIGGFEAWLAAGLPVRRRQPANSPAAGPSGS